MPNPFKVVVYAVVAVILLSIFFTYLFPFFMPKQEPIAILSKNLNVAEVELGKGITQNIQFDEMSFTGETFDTDNRSVAFECNNAAICCNFGEKDGNCSQPIEWDSRSVEIKQAREIETTARCIFEHSIFVCRIYLGKKPAQVRIAKSEIKGKINLDEEKPELDLVIENSGASPLFAGMIKAEVFEKYLENNQWVRRYVGTASIEQQFEEIEAGKRLERKIQLNVSSAGEYEVELNVKGENAGFDSNKLNFEAIGGNKCMAEYCDTPTLEFDQCKTLCHCRNCLLSSNCEQDVKKTIKQIKVGDTYREVDLADKQTTALGSNLVEVILPNEYCS